MTGDKQDMVSRLKDVLPSRWFADYTPVLDSLLGGFGWAWSYLYEAVRDARCQARISTCQGEWLDISANDYFGRRIRRRTNQGDGLFRARIRLELIRERGTRNSLSSILMDLTGRPPAIFEPANALDTGGYGRLAGSWTGFAYGVAGGWGSMNLPFQFFVTAYRPIGLGIASVTGWNGGAGGYGIGSIEYASISMIEGQVTDSDINQAIADVLPMNAIGWTRIQS